MEKIRFAHYSPNPWHQVFTQYLDKRFEPVFNTCDLDCDFIWCGSASMLIKAYPASLKYGRPLIAWVWDLPNIFPEHAARVSMYITALRECAHVIAASKHTQHVLAMYGIKADQMYFYANIADLKKGEKKNRVVQISRFTPHKQFEMVIDAVKDLGVPLTNIGRVNDPRYLEMLREKSRGADIVFKPDLPRTEMVEELCTSRVLITASKFEGWGLSPIEALFCGVPVIVSDLPVFREQYGDSVLYHDLNDPGSLKTVLKQLLESEELQTKVAARGLDKVKYCTPDKFAERWTRYIDKVL